MAHPGEVRDEEGNAGEIAKDEGTEPSSKGGLRCAKRGLHSAAATPERIEKGEHPEPDDGRKVPSRIGEGQQNATRDGKKETNKGHQSGQLYSEVYAEQPRWGSYDFTEARNSRPESRRRQQHC